MDSREENKQITTLKVICLENRDLAFMVEKLVDQTEQKYFCPKVHFKESDKKRSKGIQLIINNSGTYKVFLCYCNEDETFTPVISFRVKAEFSQIRCIRVPK